MVTFTSENMFNWEGFTAKMCFSVQLVLKIFHRNFIFCIQLNKANVNSTKQ